MWDEISWQVGFDHSWSLPGSYEFSRAFFAFSCFCPRRVRWVFTDSTHHQCISASANETQEITVLNMKQQLHYLTEQKVKQQRYMKGWQCGTEWGPIWPSAYNTHTNTRTRTHTHTQSLCWKHKLIQSRRNEWKWSRGRDSIISLRWHSSPQRGWNESTALRL